MTNELFIREGEALATKPYHYTMCGLNNIYLCNGYEEVVREGTSYFKIVDVEGLHQAIATNLVEERKTLAGREIKFIRQAMCLTQAELGERLGASSQTVARWERDKVAIPNPEDRLLRITFMVSVSEPERFVQMVQDMPKTLHDLDEAPDAPFYLSHSERWGEAA